MLGRALVIICQRREANKDDISLHKGCSVHFLRCFMLTGLERSKQKASQQRTPEFWLFFESENQAWLTGSSLEKNGLQSRIQSIASPLPRIGCIPGKLRVMRTAVYGLTDTAWEVFPEGRYEQRV